MSSYLSGLMQNKGQFTLAILFLMFLVFESQLALPLTLATAVDTIWGRIIVVVLVLHLLVNVNPILGVLGMIAAYRLFQIATNRSGLAALDMYQPTEDKKWARFSPRHQFPYTLEQEMVYKMASDRFDTVYEKTPFRPVIENTYDAARVD